MQLKQQSVLELLSHADADAVKQSQQRQVHSSMSETVAEAWKDLSYEMDLRQELLDQNVTFLDGAKQVNSAISLNLNLCCYKTFDFD